MATATPGFRPNMSIATEGSMGRRSASPLLLGGGEDLPSQPAMALIVLMPGVPEGREAHGVEREGRLHDFDGGGVFGQEAARAGAQAVAVGADQRRPRIGLHRPRDPPAQGTHSTEERR